MSDYRREQLLTYVGGPFLVLVGMLIPIIPLLPLLQHRPDDMRYGAVAAGLPLAMVFIVFGISVIREGRRRLASNHWRDEHFMP